MNKKPVKLAVFISDLDCGGAQRVVLTLLQGFLDHGYSVDLVIARDGGILTSEIPPNVQTICLCSDKTHKYLFPFIAFSRLIHYLKNTRPDAILSSVTGANLIAVLARRLASPASTLVIRHENTAPNITNNMRSWLIKKLYPVANSVITISPGAGLDLKNITGLKNEKLHVIENPVDSPKIRTLAQKSPLHPWLQDSDIPVLISVGRLYPQKDFVTLIHAFAKILKKQAARLIILGEGPERPRLESLVQQLDIEEHVLMPGIVQNPYPWMNAASLFVLSSQWEGLPIALMEAMALGCRIVATDCHSGPRELLVDGKYGTLVSVSDDNAFAKACIDMLGAPHDPQPIMSRAEDYSPDGIVTRHLQLLTENFS